VISRAFRADTRDVELIWDIIRRVAVNLMGPGQLAASFSRKIATGGARSREQRPAMYPMLFHI
jgi:hypothetical protein